MPRVAKAKSASKESSTANSGFEAKLWLTAYKLRNNMDAAKHEHVHHFVSHGIAGFVLANVTCPPTRPAKATSDALPTQNLGTINLWHD
ncbi:hypothetical protein [Prosthecobacter sp. SYSU 5D2]|uniref:hypothetical protein n=1 Tax=Prosthecobacter sp. SYSU 5D2 TaxID=3134134 RepID=UPI0031FEFDB9